MENTSTLERTPPVTSTHTPSQLTSKGRVVRAFPNAIFKYLLIGFGILVAMQLLIVAEFVNDIRPGRLLFEKFYFDREANFPAFFSAFILFFSSLLLAVIASLKRQDQDGFWRQWQGLSFVFLFLALDESVSLHELLIEPLHNMFNLTGYLRFSWVIVGGLFAVVFAVAYLKFLFSLSPQMRLRFILAGAVFVLGAVVFEMLGGNYFTDGNPDPTTDNQTPTYLVIMTLEEAFEMAGILLFISTLFAYIKQHYNKLIISVEQPGEVVRV
ncbi:hypothetical protein [Hymenobacter profundi]|uniref:Multidrug transporter n=1 Tax=Hymenobacter profundi TaxID=1982110 RepID=A0ABS6X6S5_9BACT|nr:hypothetical protein [Hymenobacter profundi]MBW3131162.1 hypothetical protein [Hymenobacter profundi]